ALALPREATVEVRVAADVADRVGDDLVVQRLDVGGAEDPAVDEDTDRRGRRRRGVRASRQCGHAGEGDGGQDDDASHDSLPQVKIGVPQTYPTGSLVISRTV